MGSRVGPQAGILEREPRWDPGWDQEEREISHFGWSKAGSRVGSRLLGSGRTGNFSKAGSQAGSMLIELPRWDPRWDPGWDLQELLSEANCQRVPIRNLNVQIDQMEFY